MLIHETAAACSCCVPVKNEDGRTAPEEVKIELQNKNDDSPFKRDVSHIPINLVNPLLRQNK